MKVFTQMVIYSSCFLSSSTGSPSTLEGEWAGLIPPYLKPGFLASRGGTSCAALISWKHSRRNQEEPLREQDLLSIKELEIRDYQSCCCCCCCCSG